MHQPLRGPTPRQRREKLQEAQRPKSMIRRLHREKLPAPAAIPRQEVLLEEIRDLLKQR